MDIVRGHQQAPPWRGAAIAIGNFDGVHRGHQALLARARALADATDNLAVALTFEPHPTLVLAPTQAPRMITTMARRLELLAAAGMDAVVVEPFTRALAARHADEFVDGVLVDALLARAVVVGYDFSYGQGRLGTTDVLRAHGERAGFVVEVVAPVAVGDEVASSSRIRAALAAGDLPRAERLLGRRYDAEGTVIHGAKRGRTIGVPTANIACDGDLLLASGIYAVRMAVEGGPWLPAVASLGTNPTFLNNGGLSFEVHVLDFDGDLYERQVRVEAVARLRDEERYDSVEALIAQIRRDIAAARTILGA
jgi:riboflavin kinase/FMN adenylyltransferase